MALNICDAAFLEDLLQKLLEGDFHERWDATKQLIAVGQVAIAYLTPLLKDEELDWEVRWFAAKALGESNTPAALDALVDLLAQTDEPELIAIAAEGISHYGDQGLDALIQLQQNPLYRLAAVQALANIYHESTLEPLLQAATDANPKIRVVALSALGNFRLPAVDTLLINAVKDPIAAVRREAITLLGLRPHLQKTTNLVEILVPGLWDINPEVTWATANSLGRLGSETAVSSMAQVLASPYTPEPLQISLVQALGWIETEAAFRVLIAAREKASLAVQTAIVEAFSRCRAPQLQQEVNKSLMDWLQVLINQPAENAVLKQAIAIALANLQCPAAHPLLVSLTDDPNEQTKLYAEAAMRQLGLNDTPS